MESVSHEGEAGGTAGDSSAKCGDDARGSGAHGPRKLTIAVKPLSFGHQRSVRDMERRGSALGQPYRLVDPFQIERDEKTHQQPTYISNAIHTSKYTLLNFLPLCLLQEFRRVRPLAEPLTFLVLCCAGRPSCTLTLLPSTRQSANLYFLVIAILQSIKQISPLTPVTAIAPLVMVVCVSLLREAIEDRVSSRSTRALVRASCAHLRTLLSPNRKSGCPTAP
jgi:hypothetical protein